MVTLEGVCAAYGESQVLFDIQLRIEPGEAVTLLGRNGVGKTTLLRTIVGLHPASAGRVCFNNEEISKLPPYERARKGIGYVPQGRGIFPHLTVEENLCMGFVALAGRGKGVQHSVPDHVYELFPALQQLRRRKGGVLSGGEQQQLAIGRALVTQPKLLILDEPTEGIQPSVVQQIEQAINNIRIELRIAILLVEQYLDFAWAIADRFYVMRGGRVVEQGKTKGREAESVAHLLKV
ncbi:MAG: urea ABC transporter ATP-binding subunit UrtE [Terriglobia bacterium]